MTLARKYCGLTRQPGATMSISLREIIGFVVRCGARFATMPDRIAMPRLTAVRRKIGSARLYQHVTTGG